MTMTDANDHALASRLATEAGSLLVELRAELTGVPRWRLMDEGDAAAHEFLVAALSASRPDDAVLSEEGADSVARLAAERVWIVDPLDGTHEYGEGRADWAVHVALWEGGALVAGAVALPVAGLTLATEPAPALPPPRDGRPRLITSRSWAPYAAINVVEALGADVMRLGSAGAKAMAVVAGEADIYVHDGGMYEWDTAAPVAVALAAGLHASRIDGSPLVYNRRDPWLPDVLICRTELAEDAIRAIWS
jgi:3'(2'), 5'-bisphosphate nucleotidase